MVTYKGELSYDEYRKCVDSCVAVKVGRKSGQLPTDTDVTPQHSQGWHSSSWRNSPYLYCLHWLISLISSLVVKGILLITHETWLESFHVPDILTLGSLMTPQHSLGKVVSGIFVSGTVVSGKFVSGTVVSGKFVSDTFVLPLSRDRNIYSTQGVH